ncbi:DUF4167 domain-containing protein [Hoeflea olei]|uniref:DUF4167 domain-containing protein n=1 Tax=Hoeflea olei TaxID=1480615 RepID=A0A1C1YXW9_9HYPH|nr:DUF4167 domain-containing protein [Hoeflea olei]OCW58317.1 hypothetical protein AWJ14_21770 [Hoeflea olei]
MRPGQQNKRGRGRGGNNSNNGGNRKGQNPLSRTYDSSGPDVKIRGTAQHVAEKYMNLARDAQSSGDRVMAENYLQHAEHYNRIILTAQAQMQERFQRDEASSQNQDDDDRESDDDTDTVSFDQRGGGNDQQPRSERQNQDRGDRNDRQQERNERRERPARAEQPSSKPAFDADAPQPVIEGVPAEVAINQEGADGEAAARPAARRRGRPKRVRTEDAAAGGASGEPAAAEAVAVE